MSRTYAGILGSLAMAVVICRGWLNAAGVEGTLWCATLYLVLFAVAGGVLGHLAQSTIDQSVQAQLQEQLTRQSQGAARQPST